MEVFIRQHLLQSFVLCACLYVLDFNLRNSDPVVAAGIPEVRLNVCLSMQLVATGCNRPILLKK